MELNPESKIIKKLEEFLSLSDENAKRLFQDLVRLLFDTASTASGYSLDNPGVYSYSVYNMISFGLGLKDDQINEQKLEESEKSFPKPPENFKHQPQNSSPDIMDMIPEEPEHFVDEENFYEPPPTSEEQ